MRCRVVIWPIVASAQTGTSIAGVVKDESGGALPGVTVEVSSPALIEKVRTAVTDGEGRYSIISLRPGIYKVTFTLTGFGTVVREGIELTSDFTANVNADMKVGTLQESITVTGESPIVDTPAITQRVRHDPRCARRASHRPQHSGGRHHDSGNGARARRRRRAVARRRRIGRLAAVAAAVPRIRRHGADHRRTCGSTTSARRAQYSGVYWNDASFEEYSYVTGADSAEMGQGGMRVNMVPRDGGNQFHGQFFGNYAGESLGVGQLRFSRFRQRRPAALHPIEPYRQHDVQSDQHA